MFEHRLAEHERRPAEELAKLARVAVIGQGRLEPGVGPHRVGDSRHGVMVGMHVEAAERVDPPLEESGDRGGVERALECRLDGGQCQEEVAGVTPRRADDAAVVAAVDAREVGMEHQRGELDPAHRERIAEVFLDLLDREGLRVARRTRGGAIGRRTSQRSRIAGIAGRAEPEAEPLRDPSGQRRDIAQAPPFEHPGHLARALAMLRDDDQGAVPGLRRSGSDSSRSFGIQSEPGMYPSGPMKSWGSRTSISRTEGPWPATNSTGRSGEPISVRNNCETQFAGPWRPRWRGRGCDGRRGGFR